MRYTITYITHFSDYNHNHTKSGFLRNVIALNVEDEESTHQNKTLKLLTLIGIYDYYRERITMKGIRCNDNIYRIYRIQIIGRKVVC